MLETICWVPKLIEDFPRLTLAALNCPPLPYPLHTLPPDQVQEQGQRKGFRGQPVQLRGLALEQDAAIDGCGNIRAAPGQGAQGVLAGPTGPGVVEGH